MENQKPNTTNKQSKQGQHVRSEDIPSIHLKSTTDADSYTLNPKNQTKWNTFGPATRTRSDEVIRVRKKRKKHSKAPFIILGIVILVVIASAAEAFGLYSSATTLKTQAKQALEEVSSIQSTLFDGDYTAAAGSAQNLSAVAKNMENEMSSPLWSVASLIPIYGEDVSNAKTLVCSLSDVSNDALLPLTQTLEASPISSLVTSDGSIDISSLDTLLDAIVDTSPALQQCSDTMSNLKTFHLQELETLSVTAKDKILAINDAAQTANTFAPLISTVLGADGNRKYLIVAQNTAEMRSSGGFPGSIGTADIDGGTITLNDFSKVYDMLSADMPSTITITADEMTLFSEHRMSYPRDVGLDPDFPRVASIWAEAYYARSGSRVDGVLSITPSVVQDILTVTGSITLSDGTTLDATNATTVLQHDLYWKYMGSDGSNNGDYIDDLFAEAARLTFDSILDTLSSSNLMKLGDVMVKRFSTREIMLWFSDTMEQNSIEGLNCSGTIVSLAKNPQLGVFFTANRASKLGWYVDTQTTIKTSMKNSDGSYTYQVTSTFTNTVTQEEYNRGSTYVLGGDDANMIPYIYIYAPTGGEITEFSSTSSTPFEQGEHEGRQVYYMKEGALRLQESITCTYTVKTSTEAQTELEVITNPTLISYRESS